MFNTQTNDEQIEMATSLEQVRDLADLQLALIAGGTGAVNLE